MVYREAETLASKGVCVELFEGQLLRCSNDCIIASYSRDTLV